MNNPKKILKEISRIQNVLIQHSILTHYRATVIKSNKRSSKVEWDVVSDLSIVLKKLEYREIYDQIDVNQDYNFKLIDGTIIQMQYEFEGKSLFKHRLAMFPSPYLIDYEEEVDGYKYDLYMFDFLSGNKQTFPIRFDYNSEVIASNFHHPKSHLSLGQVKNCRIPVNGPLSPMEFMVFIIEHFYNSYSELYKNSIGDRVCGLKDDILAIDRGKLHLTRNP